MQVRKITALALGLAAVLSAPLAAAELYTLDNAHTEIGFEISHFNLFKAHGTFDKFDGAIQYDDKDVTKSSVDVKIEGASINTRNEMRDKHLRSDAFFDVDKNPVESFKSTKVEKAEDGSLKISGDLTLRGVTKAVVLDAKITGSLEGVMGEQRLGFSAKTTINRMDYGIAWNKTNKSGTAMLGDNVDILIQGEAVKGGKKGPKPADKK